MNHLKAWWATHLTLIVGVVTLVTPSVNAFVAGHPKSAVIVGGLWAILLNQLKSPSQTTPVQ